MLRDLIFLIFWSVFSVFESNASTSLGENQCRQESPDRGTPCNKKHYQNNTDQIKSFFKNSFLQKEILELKEESLKKVDSLQQTKEFQDLVADLEGKWPDFSVNQKNASKQNADLPDQKPEGSLYVFVSFSMGEKALLNLAHEAKHYGATLVLRGFKKETLKSGVQGYAKTVKALQQVINKTGQGFIIDPELFDLFSIQAVPTFILTKPFPLNAIERTQTPIHDRLQGHVSLHYALNIFIQKGDLKEAAQALLDEGKKP